MPRRILPIVLLFLALSAQAQRAGQHVLPALTAVLERVRAWWPQVSVQHHAEKARQPRQVVHEGTGEAQLAQVLHRLPVVGKRQGVGCRELARDVDHHLGHHQEGVHHVVPQGQVAAQGLRGIGRARSWPR